MTVDKFISTFVKVEEIEPGVLGYYPFHLVAIDQDDKMQVNVLCGLNSQECYGRFRTVVQEGNDRVIMAVDFPKSLDVPNDFVLIFHFNKTVLDFQIIQYDESGKIVENEDKEYNLVKQIIGQFTSFMLASNEKETY
jgi:hypothetical protein